MTEERKFENIGLSQKCIRGLNDCNYIYPTKIQVKSIESAMQGLDILGSAKTGSGKTLAFLIPVLERLEKEKFTKEDGLGCIIITPTRELAYQIFKVLKQVGKYFDFSAGLVFGGKDLEDEAKFIKNINILICTPGRLLQHMDQTSVFDCTSLKILVIDEADKLMELDFADSINAIIEHLPDDRQTLLFSATLNGSILDLARLSLKSPVVINAHEENRYVTPNNLQQFYAVCELQEKINFLFSFIKTHLKSKIIVFMSCCKQVRYIYEAFRQMSPGIILACLHGRMSQGKRMDVFDKFMNTSSCVLFATDLASRGLDFPSVEWVIQFDCPSNTQTYIHRVGRTARFNKNGNSLLIILPSEIQFISCLNAEKIPIDQIFSKESRKQDISNYMASFCARDTNTREFAKKCLISYVKYVYYQPNKSIFNVNKLPVKKYAKSLGLANIPDFKFLKPSTAQSILPWDKDDQPDQAEDFLVPTENPTDLSKFNHLVERQKTNIVAKSKTTTKAQMAKKVLKKGIQVNSRIVFDQEDQ